MNPRDELVKFRLERATESLDEADLMADGAHWNTCMNRLYYACFYAATAFLVHQGLASSKHAGIRSLLHQHFVNEGKLPVDMGRLYDQLFEARNQADYIDFVTLKQRTYDRGYLGLVSSSAMLSACW